jgi:glutamyl-tRNA synthetase
VQERTKLLPEVTDQVRFLLDDDLRIDPVSWDRVMGGPEVGSVLAEAAARLAAIDPFQPADIETALRGLLQELGIGAKKGLQPIRVAVTGSAVSPPLFESLAALGRERAVARIEAARAGSATLTG